MFGRKPLRTVTTWDAAINKIADKFQSCIDKYGRDSIAFYVSGQLLTEDYYVVNKFVKAIWALQISIPTHAFACHLQWQVTNVVSVKILCLQVMKILNMQIWWFWLVPIPHGAILCCISGLCRLKATIQICLLWWLTHVLPVLVSKRIYIYRFYRAKMSHCLMVYSNIYIKMVMPIRFCGCLYWRFARGFGK